jgi:hypothetical protein
MYVRRGDYPHEANENRFQFRIMPQYADNNLVVGYKKSVHLEGMLFGANASELATKQAALVAAYTSVTGNFTVLQNDNATEIPTYKILGTQTIGGIRLISIEFPARDQGEWVTWLKYVIDIEADIGGVGIVGGQGGGQSVLLSWNESISIRGNGGPRTVIRTPVNGSPVRQVVSQRTPIFASQRGSAVGLYRYPTPPQPIWPQHRTNPDEEITKDTADTVGGTGNQQQRREFRISWNYQFAAPTSLNANPSTGF